jgi:transglutaminase-like putative cysteine protease
MAEQKQGSIKDRIAALNLEEVHQPVPSARPTFTFEQAPAALKKRPPPPPPRPQVPQRQQTINNPPIYSNAPTSSRHLGNQPSAERPPPPRLSPALPPRPPPRSSSQQSPALPARSSPALPPRKASAHSISRRGSNESISTIASGISAYSLGSAVSNGDQLYTIRAPAYDPSKLPALPPKTKTSEAPKKDSATLRAMRSTSSDRPDKRLLPPVLPSRPTAPVPVRRESKAQENLRPQRSQVFPSPRVSALSLGMNKSTEIPPPVPGRSYSEHGAPPPIPMSSRPNLNAIMASKPKPGATGSCLKCRDFTGPDSHASRFPRETIPSSDVEWLSIQLTSPFSSATDKARAIFTWLHHNVDYDVHSFFGGTVTGTTPERVIRTGLAVCQGYADLFCALALKAGLECMVISGSGKGFGHTALKPGEPIPPFSSNHAWNVVRIDNGEWKLVDPCWGAGTVSGMNEPYNRSFNPRQ